MNSNTYIRKIDILDLIGFCFRHLKEIIIVAIIGMLISGGYRANVFRVNLNNQEYVKQAEAVVKIRSACMVYVNGKDYNSSASERVVDVSAIVKSYDAMSKAMEECNITTVNYQNMCNCVFVTVVGNNMIEIAVDFTNIPGTTIEDSANFLKVLVDETNKLVGKFEEENFITIMEDIHEGAYHLEKSLNGEDENKGLDIVSELIGIVRYCVMGIMAGIAVTVILLCIVYLLSPVLRTEEDMCHGFGNVVIGKMFGKDKESMRKAKTVITHDGSHKAVNLISITDKEERDFAAEALAASLSVNGTKAVYVNACKSSEAKGKGMNAFVEGKAALKDIIVSDAEYDSIYRKDEEEKLDIFAHENFKKLIDELKNKYDYVVVNSPAYSKSADGMLISAVCDKTVVIAGRNIVKEEQAIDLCKNLVSNEVAYAGIVLTK